MTSIGKMTFRIMLKTVLMFTLIVITIPTDVTNGTATNNIQPFCNLRERGIAAMAMQRESGAPPELDHLIQSYNPDNDWLALENALADNERTNRLLKIVRQRRKDFSQKRMNGIMRLYSTGTSSNEVVNEVMTNDRGFIIGLDLRRLGLTDHDLDLSKLPSGLIVLDLSWNDFQNIKWESLPKSLKVLRLNYCNIQSVDMSQLPIGLENIWLWGNKLNEVDLTSCHKTLNYVNLRGMQITNIWWNEDRTPLWNRDYSGPGWFVVVVDLDYCWESVGQ